LCFAVVTEFVVQFGSPGPQWGGGGGGGVRAGHLFAPWLKKKDASDSKPKLPRFLSYAATARGMHWMIWCSPGPISTPNKASAVRSACPLMFQEAPVGDTHFCRVIPADTRCAGMASSAIDQDQGGAKS
jgi:hypothetical protein